MNDQINALKTKYLALENSEQKIVLLGAIVVVIFVLYSLIYKPLNSSIEQLQASNQSSQELLVWMAESVASLKGGTKSSPGVDKRRGRSLNVIINTTASVSKISISRSQPRDNDQYQIWLDKAVFNDVMAWLNVLQQDYGIHVSSINLGSTQSKGLVGVNLTFQDQGSQP